MNKGRHTLAALALCALTPSALAASLVEHRIADQLTSQMWIEGELMRFHLGPLDQYTVFDVKNGRVYGVHENDKKIVESEMPTPDEDAAAADGVKMTVKDTGAGPTIAGYATRRYLLTANGAKCGEFNLSKQALKDSGMQAIVETVQSLAGAKAKAEKDACGRAKKYMATRYAELGLPMQEIGANGKVRIEVTRIEKNAELPTGGFTLPKDYRRVDLQTHLRELFEASH